MTEISEDQLFRGKNRPDSFYEFITATFISRPLVAFMARIGIKSPNSITVVSFVLIIVSCVLIVLWPAAALIKRIIIALLIEISFILDSSDGQLARVLKKTSFFGSWLDKYLDRIGEMALYMCIGYVVWQTKGHFIFFIMGISIGYLFTYYTIIYSVKDSVELEGLKRDGFFKGEMNKTSADEKDTDMRIGRKKNNKKNVLGKKFFKDKTIYSILAVAFFYLNLGSGERYLYPIFFILINRTDIMLPIVLTLIFLRAGNVTMILARRIKKIKPSA